MARTDFPLSIGRRQLLASAEVTAIGIVPGVKTANSAAGLDYGQPSVMPGAEPACFSAATARRLVEIARRNEIRREVQLPLLSIPAELRRMKDQETREEFERFEAAYAKAVWDEVLKNRREAEDKLNWRQSWMQVTCPRIFGPSIS
jgi:hypothetical protein